MVTPDKRTSSGRATTPEVPPHRLVCLSSSMKGLSLSIESPTKDEFVLGRQNGMGSADLTFSDATVSSRHCVICRANNGNFSLRDLGSLNGTCINGKRVGTDSVALNDGDVIALGEFEVMYRAKGQYHYTAPPRQVVALNGPTTRTLRLPSMTNLTPFRHDGQAKAAKVLVAGCLVLLPLVLFVLGRLVIRLLY